MGRDLEAHTLRTGGDAADFLSTGWPCQLGHQRLPLAPRSASDFVERSRLTDFIGWVTITSMFDASNVEVMPVSVDRELLKGSTATLVLSVLSRAPMHGYQMVKELEQLSAGVLTFKEGTLYPILHGLERDGLIVAAWEAEGGRERKVYHLSEQGRGELRRRAQQWEQFRAAVDVVVRGGVFAYAGA